MLTFLGVAINIDKFLCFYMFASENNSVRVNRRVYLAFSNHLCLVSFIHCVVFGMLQVVFGMLQVVACRDVRCVRVESRKTFPKYGGVVYFENRNHQLPSSHRCIINFRNVSFSRLFQGGGRMISVKWGGQSFARTLECRASRRVCE